MIRSAILACGVVSLIAFNTRAEDKPAFAVTATASRSTDHTILVSASISENKIEEVPKVGKTNVSTVLSTPKLIFNEGHDAEIVIGDSPTTNTSGQPAKSPGEIGSGVKVDVISVKGREEILLVTKVLENGEIVWADTARVPITTKAAAAK